MKYLSEFRRDEIYKRNVIISTTRGNRPQDFNNICDENNKVMWKKNCPFCLENEDNTPHEIFSLGDPWRVRVIPNKYPVLDKDGLGVMGYHFVVVEGTKHSKSLYQFTENEFIEILYSYKKALDYIYVNKNISKVQIFKNYKKGAGASLEHPHSQIVAMDKDCDNIYFGDKRCILCSEIKEELIKKERVVLESDNYICYAPYGSAFTYELRIAPKSHKSSFVKLTEVDFKEISWIYCSIFKRINKFIGDIPLNICYNFIKENTDNYHFFIEIIPRISMQAGFEQGTGMFINTVLPEDAAKLLSQNIL